MKFKISFGIFIACEIGAILLLAMSKATDKLWLIPAALIVLAAGVVQGLIYYRCPACGALLFKVKGVPPRHCPDCGAEIR